MSTSTSERRSASLFGSIKFKNLNNTLGLSDEELAILSSAPQLLTFRRNLELFHNSSTYIAAEFREEVVVGLKIVSRLECQDSSPDDAKLLLYALSQRPYKFIKIGDRRKIFNILTQSFVPIVVLIQSLNRPSWSSSTPIFGEYITDLLKKITYKPDDFRSSNQQAIDYYNLRVDRSSYLEALESALMKAGAHRWQKGRAQALLVAASLPEEAFWNKFSDVWRPEISSLDLEESRKFWETAPEPKLPDAQQIRKLTTYCMEPDPNIREDGHRFYSGTVLTKDSIAPDFPMLDNPIGAGCIGGFIHFNYQEPSEFATSEQKMEESATISESQESVEGSKLEESPKSPAKNLSRKFLAPWFSKSGTFIVTAYHVIDKDLQEMNNGCCLYSRNFDFALLPAIPNIAHGSQLFHRLTEDLYNNCDQLLARFPDTPFVSHWAFPDGTEVFKVGPSTGFTRGFLHHPESGVVLTVKLAGKNNEDHIKLSDPVRVRWEDGGCFALPGDSGSIYFARVGGINFPIGVHRTSSGGLETPGSTPTARYSYGTPLHTALDQVCQNLNLTMDQFSFCDSSTCTPLDS